MSLRKKLLLTALIVSIGVGLYCSFWFFLYAAAENGPGYHLDRTPGDRYFRLAAADWLLVVLPLFWLLKRR